MPMSCAGSSTSAGHLAVRVADQNHLRVRVADGRDPAHQAVGGQHGQIFADAVAAAEVNLHDVPPIGGVAHDDVGELEVPRASAAASRKARAVARFPAPWRRLARLEREAARFRGEAVSNWRSNSRRGRTASAAVIGSCWAVPASPKSGKNQLPTASLSGNVACGGRLRSNSVASVTAPSAM